MKASLKILSSQIINGLRSVKRDDSPVKVGDFFALNGAWDRKKICVKVTSKRNVSMWDTDEDGGGDVYPFVYPLVQTVHLQNIGRIYHDGRWVKPTRASKPIVIDIYYTNVGGWLVANPPRHSGYLKVLPVFGSAVDRSKLNVVRNKTIDVWRAKFDRHSGAFLGRQNQITGEWMR